MEFLQGRPAPVVSGHLRGTHPEQHARQDVAAIVAEEPRVAQEPYSSKGTLVGGLVGDFTREPRSKKWVKGATGPLNPKPWATRAPDALHVVVHAGVVDGRRDSAFQVGAAGNQQPCRHVVPV